MDKVNIDQFTKDQAIDFADNDADLKGYERGGVKWQGAVKRYLTYALSTMSVGRNPRAANPRDIKSWPMIFGDSGFAGKVSANFKDKENRKVPVEEIRNRIKSSVNNLTYMFLNGIFDIKTTTKGRTQGLIPEEEMSDLQLQSARGRSREELDALNKDIFFAQLAQTVIETACLEALIPFFTMTKDDVEAILGKISMEGKLNIKNIGEHRLETEKHLRNAAEKVFSKISYRKVVLGE